MDTRIEMKELLHYTDSYSLWRILHTGIFCVNFNARDSYHYDWGLNFVGKRGKLANHQISDKKCELICEWDGDFSELLPYSSLRKVEKTLYNYDYPSNQDARYLLSVGSQPLVTKFKFDDEDELFDSWLAYHMRFGRPVMKLISRNPLLVKIFKKSSKLLLIYSLKSYMNYAKVGNLQLQYQINIFDYLFYISQMTIG